MYPLSVWKRQTSCLWIAVGTKLPGSTGADFEAQLALTRVFYEWRVRREKEFCQKHQSENKRLLLVRSKTPTWLTLGGTDQSVQEHVSEIWDAGLEKSRNLGIGFWRGARRCGDTLLQLSWKWMTWVWRGEKQLTHTHRNTCAHMANLYCLRALCPSNAGLGSKMRIGSSLCVTRGIS